MQEIYVENIKEVIRGKRRLERELGVKVSNKGKNVFVDGDADDEYLALQVLEAVNIGFSVDVALKLKEEEGIILQRVHIKDITKRGDLDRVRGRIIGSKGRTLATLKKLTNCDISLHDNEIGLIGDAERMDDSIQAVTSLVQGSKQGNVYARLERESKKKRLTSKDEIKNELR
jgi:ribosomal RNA assembly protein